MEPAESGNRQDFLDGAQPVWPFRMSGGHGVIEKNGIGNKERGHENSGLLRGLTLPLVSP